MELITVHSRVIFYMTDCAFVHVEDSCMHTSMLYYRTYTYALEKSLLISVATSRVMLEVFVLSEMHVVSCI